MEKVGISALEVFYENALYKFTFDIDIDNHVGLLKFECHTLLTSRRRWALWNLLRINVYLGLWVLGRNDPKLGADRPRSWGGSTGTRTIG